jgi:hypothetical protein
MANTSAALIDYMIGPNAYVSLQAKLENIGVSVDDFGATPVVGGVLVDSTAAIQAALNAAGANGGGTVYGAHSYYISSSITVPSNVTLQGPLAILGEQFNNPLGYAAVNGTLLLSNAATIQLGNMAGVRNWNIVNSALVSFTFSTYAQAQAVITGFAGTAIRQTAGSNPSGGDALVENCMIIGFNQAIQTTNKERGNFRNLKIDCTNGIQINEATDIPYLSNIECWPFLFAHCSISGTYPQLGLRSGTAYSILSEADAIELTNCFSFGYTTGFNCAAPIVTTLLNCAADGNGSLVGTTVNGSTWQPIGVNISNNADKIKILVL